uniref:Uncharacterized protein n=1 Tax=Pycnococcus provasolii TaxID=41880 RepID=A0A6T5WJK8_9CHLO|mmetsp:Transcript_2558/g.5658  ORF Transcript_2558/g.5658 Transcript_2558/m.5658 type:complete len:768 (+) Transcript_2558:1-2304(+)
MNVEDIMKYVQKQKQTRDLDTLGMGANGMQLCFIRLKPDPKRTKEDADVIAGRWKSLLMTAASEEALYSIDKDTLLISVDGSRLKEARKFVLTRPEAAEFEHQSTTWVLAGNDGDDDDDNDGEPKFKVQNRNTATKPPPPPPNPADVLKQTTTDKKNKKDKKKDKKDKDTWSRRRFWDQQWNVKETTTWRRNKRWNNRWNNNRYDYYYRPVVVLPPAVVVSGPPVYVARPPVVVVDIAQLVWASWVTYAAASSYRWLTSVVWPSWYSVNSQILLEATQKYNQGQLAQTGTTYYSANEYAPAKPPSAQQPSIIDEIATIGGGIDAAAAPSPPPITIDNDVQAAGVGDASSPTTTTTVGGIDATLYAYWNSNSSTYETECSGGYAICTPVAYDPDSATYYALDDETQQQEEEDGELLEATTPQRFTYYDADSANYTYDKCAACVPVVYDPLTSRYHVTGVTSTEAAPPQEDLIDAFVTAMGEVVNNEPEPELLADGDDTEEVVVVEASNGSGTKVPSIVGLEGLSDEFLAVVKPYLDRDLFYDVDRQSYSTIGCDSCLRVQYDVVTGEFIVYDGQFGLLPQLAPAPETDDLEEDDLEEEEEETIEVSSGEEDSPTLIDRYAFLFAATNISSPMSSQSPSTVFAITNDGVSETLSLWYGEEAASNITSLVQSLNSEDLTRLRRRLLHTVVPQSVRLQDVAEATSVTPLCGPPLSLIPGSFFTVGGAGSGATASVVLADVPSGSDGFLNVLTIVPDQDLGVEQVDEWLCTE